MSHLKLLVHVTGMCTLGFLLILPVPGYAQITRGGARAAALGEAATALRENIWAVHNPALAATIEQYCAELFGSQSFGLSELQLAAVSVAGPVPQGVVLLNVQTFGFSQYRNTQFGLGYARRFRGSDLPTAAVGGVLIYDHYRIAAYGSSGAVGAVVGGSLHLSSTLLVGFQAANIHRSPERSTPTLPQQLAVGISYRPDDHVQLLIDLQKDVRYPISVHTGIEFLPTEVAALRIGVATVPRIFSAGIGVSADPINGGVAFVHHYALGWSPAISLGTRW